MQFHHNKSFSTFYWKGGRTTQEDTIVVGEIGTDNEITTDALMETLKKNVNSSVKLIESSASTAVVAIVRPNGNFEISHLGDSPACLVNVLEDGSITFELLTQNIHNCDNNTEWNRLKEMTDKITEDPAGHKIFGRRLAGLTPSRLFISQHFIRNQALPEKADELEKFCTTHENSSIQSNNLQKAKRKFLLLFSDGLYCTSTKEVGKAYTIDDVLLKGI